MIGSQIEAIDTFMREALLASRTPGAAVAVVERGEVVLCKGYGLRDRANEHPVTAATVYPIASTSKAINATLLGMLVDEGKLEWDRPVQCDLPQFRLRDPVSSTQVTLRDLLVMRTGLPRHDWLWMENPMSRADLMSRLRHLDLSAGFRERFQYNNITATAAGHLAEVVGGESWEELVQKRIFNPIGMRSTGFTLPEQGDVTLSYHENRSREIHESTRLACSVTAPSGGAIHSTVQDMARWMLFNLNGGKVGENQLIQPRTLSEIQSPQVAARTDSSCPTPNATYAMGWFVDTYNGHARVSHGGYVHDVNSEVSLFPEDALGIVSFVNFGFPMLARLINQHVFDVLVGTTPVQPVAERMAVYEKRLVENQERLAAVKRVANTLPSHHLAHYAGRYMHAGYGVFEVSIAGDDLVLRRNSLMLPLQHWHYDIWAPRDTGIFYPHLPHAFDSSNRVVFESNADGEIAAFSMRLEPSVAPLRFERLS